MIGRGECAFFAGCNRRKSDRSEWVGFRLWTWSVLLGNERSGIEVDRLDRSDGVYGRTQQSFIIATTVFVIALCFYHYRVWPVVLKASLQNRQHYAIDTTSRLIGRRYGLTFTDAVLPQSSCHIGISVTRNYDGRRLKTEVSILNAAAWLVCNGCKYDRISPPYCVISTGCAMCILECITLPCRSCHHHHHHIYFSAEHQIKISWI